MRIPSLTAITILGLLASGNAVGDFQVTEVNGRAAAIDRENGLTWLNWGETRGWSRPAIESELTAGGQFEGWRYATGDELEVMLQSFFPFFTPSSPSYQEGTRYGFRTVTYSDGLLFDSLITSEMDVFGHYIGGVSDYGHSRAAQAIYGDVAFGLDSGGVIIDLTQTVLVFDGLIKEPTWEDAIRLYTYRYQESWPQIGHALVRDSSGISVEIDVKPDSDSNCFDVNGRGVIPIAVLGSDSFEVADIDQNTLSFGGLDVRVRGNKAPMCHLDDVNLDGFYDLVCHFQDNAEYWEPGEDDASLTGTLLDGTEFRGTDSICVVP